MASHWLIGRLSGNTNPLQPLSFAFLQNHSISDNSKKFIPVYTLADVQHQLNLAKTQNKLTMIDFYADWYISCKEMEQFTFSNLQIGPKSPRLLPAIACRRDLQRCRQTNSYKSPFRCHSPEPLLNRFSSSIKMERKSPILVWSERYQLPNSYAISWK